MKKITIGPYTFYSKSNLSQSIIDQTITTASLLGYKIYYSHIQTNHYNYYYINIVKFPLFLSISFNVQIENDILKSIVFKPFKNHFLLNEEIFKNNFNQLFLKLVKNL